MRVSCGMSYLISFQFNNSFFQKNTLSFSSFGEKPSKAFELLDSVLFVVADNKNCRISCISFWALVHPAVSFSSWIIQ